MSYESEPFLNIKFVTDHDCGNYFIGELEGIDIDSIERYIERFGEDGYKEIKDMVAVVLGNAYMQIKKYRSREQTIANAMSVAEKAK